MWLPNEARPGLHHLLPSLVLWMRLARDNELHGMVGIGEETREPLGIMQKKIRTLVGGKTPGKPKGQGVGIKNVALPVATSAGMAPEAASCRAKRSRA